MLIVKHRQLHQEMLAPSLHSQAIRMERAATVSGGTVLNG